MVVYYTMFVRSSTPIRIHVIIGESKILNLLKEVAMFQCKLYDGADKICVESVYIVQQFNLF